jgi:hypothetical protein
MMSGNNEIGFSTFFLTFPALLILGFIMTTLFFIIDWYNENKIKQLKETYISLISGISIAYFFLVLLPEISENMPEYPLHLRLLEFFFVLLGFVFIHVTEKLILQKVDRKAQDRIRKLLTMERNLDIVETQIGHIIKEQLNQQEIDEYALEDLARVISELIEQEETLKEQDKMLKIKIQNHINEDLDNIHIFTNFTYHFFIGLILFNLLLIDLLVAILFFFFAFFMALLSKTSNDVIIFPDVEINEKSIRPKHFIYLLSSAAIFGFLTGLILEFSYPISLEILYILFSFISGVILYIIVREVIPEKQRGKPFYFLLGVTILLILVLTIRTLGYTLLT